MALFVSSPCSSQVVYKVEPERLRKDHIVSKGKAAALLQEMLALEGQPFIFVVNFQVPGDPPLSMVHFFGIPDRASCPPDAGPFFRMLDKFLHFTNNPLEGEEESQGEEEEEVGPRDGEHLSVGDVSPLLEPDVHLGEFSLDDFKNRRFKLIPLIVDGPMAVKWAVGAKPTLLGQKVTQR